MKMKLIQDQQEKNTIVFNATLKTLRAAIVAPLSLPVLRDQQDRTIKNQHLVASRKATITRMITFEFEFLYGKDDLLVTDSLYKIYEIVLADCFGFILEATTPGHRSPLSLLFYRLQKKSCY